MLNHLTPNEKRLFVRLTRLWRQANSGYLVARQRIHYWRAKLVFELAKVFIRRKRYVEVVLWLIAAIGSAAILPWLERQILPLADAKTAEAMQSLTLALGGALIGATAIAASFVLFAMQVNVERLPYGLFHRFSSDPKLLSIFGLSFLMAIGGASLSLASDAELVARIGVLSLWIAVVVLRMLLLAYRRSVELISPIHQLGSIYKQADKQLAAIEKQLTYRSRLVQTRTKNRSVDETIDMNRRSILDANVGWDNQLRVAIENSVSYARRAGMRGDPKISKEALGVVVALNTRYLKIKDKTFFGNNPLFANPLVTDGTINLTLEALRQLLDMAIARKDEVQIEQLFSTFAELSTAYAQIDYEPGQTKSHALLAKGYLERGIEATLPHGLVDCTMHGVRMLAAVAKVFITLNHSDDATGCISKISILGMVGAASEKHRPVTLTAVAELRDILLLLIHPSDDDAGFAIEETRNSLTQIAQAVLQIPDSPLASIHSTYLAPYFSSTSFESFRGSIGAILRNIENVESPEIKERYISNLARWSDGLYSDAKKLLLLSIEKRTHFTFDCIHFITGFTSLLLHASSLPIIHSVTREKLLKNANWLLACLTWIPRDKETTAFVENFSLRDEVLGVALDAHRAEWEDGFKTAWDFMLNWAFSAGRHQNGWSVLDRWLSALAAVALHIGQSEELKARVSACLLADPDFPKALREAAARNLRRQAISVRPRDFDLDIVNQGLSQIDRDEMQTLLREIAKILCPDISDEDDLTDYIL